MKNKQIKKLLYHLSNSIGVLDRMIYVILNRFFYYLYRIISIRCDECYEVHKESEMYMVYNKIWKQVKGHRYLHKKCLEKRLGRKLRKEDFTKAPINYNNGYLTK